MAPFDGIPRANEVDGSSINVDERSRAYVQAIDIAVSKKSGKEVIGRIPRHPEGSEVGMLQALASKNHELPLQHASNFINKQAIKIIGRHLNINPMWQLNEEQIDELCSYFPAQKQGERSENYIKRLISLHANPEIEDRDANQAKQMIGNIMMLLLIEQKVNDELKKRDGEVPRYNEAHDREVHEAASKIQAEIQKNHGASSVEKKEKAGIPEKVGNLKELVSIVERNPNIKAVSFDLMDTVIYWGNDRLTRQREFFNEAMPVLARHGINVTMDEFIGVHGIDYKEPRGIWYELRQKSFNSRDGYECRFDELMTAVLTELCKRKRKNISSGEMKSTVADLEKVYVANETKTIKPMPFAKDTLEKLKRRGIKIMLLSNAIEDEKAIKGYLEKAGLLEYFDSVFVSYEVGYQKHYASTRFFDHMVSKSGMQKDQIIHIGDNEWADFKGAKNAGLHPIFYERNSNITDLVHAQQRNYVATTREYEPLSDDVALARMANFEKRMQAEGIPENEKGEMRRLIARMYEISRDYYSPATMGFSVELLNSLKNNPENLNLCTGRDSLILFIQQKLLLRKFKQKFQGVNPDQVQYLPLSRRLVGGSASLSPEWRERMKDKPWITTEDEPRLRRYLASAGFDKYKKVTFIDNGFSGTTQTEIERRQPNKDIEGKYLVSNAGHTSQKKRGYFGGFVNLKKHGKDGVEREITRDSADRSDFGDRYADLIRWRPMWMIEDFFNGIQTSSEYFTGRELTKSGGVSVPQTNMEKLTDKKKKLLKLAGVYGMIDSVTVHGEKIASNPKMEARARIDKFMAWTRSVTLQGEGRDWINDNYHDPRLTEQHRADRGRNIDAKLLGSLWRHGDTSESH